MAVFQPHWHIGRAKETMGGAVNGVFCSPGGDRGKAVGGYVPVGQASWSGQTTNALTWVTAYVLSRGREGRRALGGMLHR